MTNVSTILSQAAATHPTKTAIVAGDTELDYATVDLLARMFAGALRDRGVQPGEHVALVLPNVPSSPSPTSAATNAGNPVLPLNVMLTADELGYHLDDIRPSPSSPRTSSFPPCSRPPHWAALPGRPPHWAALPGRPPASHGHHRQVPPTARPVQEAHPAHAGDTAVILYTSGTTGRPKGAELTHANLLANAQVPHQLVGLGAETVALAALPLFHAFGMTVMHNAVLAVGGTIVLQPRFSAAGAAELMARHRVTFFGGVPTMYMALLQQNSADLSTLRWCVSGGAPMPAEVMTAFEQRFGVTLLEGYGLSETSPVPASPCPSCRAHPTPFRASSWPSSTSTSPC